MFPSSIWWYEHFERVRKKYDQIRTERAIICIAIVRILYILYMVELQWYITDCDRSARRREIDDREKRLTLYSKISNSELDFCVSIAFSSLPSVNTITLCICSNNTKKLVRFIVVHHYWWIKSRFPSVRRSVLISTVWLSRCSGFFFSLLPWSVCGCVQNEVNTVVIDTFDIPFFSSLLSGCFWTCWYITNKCICESPFECHAIGQMNKKIISIRIDLHISMLLCVWVLFGFLLTRDVFLFQMWMKWVYREWLSNSNHHWF